MKRMFWLMFSAALLSACAPKRDTTAQPTSCTEEAKVCDDGSTVVRGGPDCAFAACPGEGEAAVCTQEAKECADGSYVGRSGPDCAFEACPGEGEGVVAGYPCEEGQACPGMTCEGDDCPSL